MEIVKCVFNVHVALTNFRHFSLYMLAIIVFVRNIVTLECRFGHVLLFLQTRANFTYYSVLRQEGQHPLTGHRAANFRRDLEAT